MVACRWILAMLLTIPCFGATAADQEGFGAGATIETLVAGQTTYHQAKVLSVNARTVVIRHAGGMSSIRLRDLSPEWQARFHYDPAGEAAADQALREAPKPAPVARPATRKNATRFESLLQQFGKPADVRAEVDLRQKFFDLQLGVKDQGRRPSCSVFAVVSALEFQNAELAGKAEKFSEEYLIWAVRQTTQRLPVAGDTAETAEDKDEGFTLSEVVSALRAYGIPLQASMPNTFGRKIAAIEGPPPAIVDEARNHQRVFIHAVPGRDAPTRLNNIILALNAGVPVPIGVAWPNYRSMRTGYVSGQKPMAGAGHAITLVGYKSSTGRLEDAVFVFKNSWGVDWGQGGYGTVTYDYLSRYLGDAVLLEVQAG